MMPRAVVTEMGVAEIRSTAHSERSNRTCGWSQQASRRSISPGELPPGIDSLTLSALWYWYCRYYEEYVQFLTIAFGTVPNNLPLLAVTVLSITIYYCYTLDPYIDI